jgi:hypothetical protein
MKKVAEENEKRCRQETKYLSVSCTEGMAFSLSPRTPVTPPPNSQLIRVQIFIDTFSSLDIFFKMIYTGLKPVLRIWKPVPF